jgi:hypothetical protein
MSQESETINALVVALHDLIDNRQAAEARLIDLETDLDTWYQSNDGDECNSPEMVRAKRLLEKVTGKKFKFNGMNASELI